MRERKLIEEESNGNYIECASEKKGMSRETMTGIDILLLTHTQRIILEVLLDIRDLLQNPPKEKNYQVKIPNRE